MWPPTELGFPSDQMRVLIKGVCGLADAPLMWYETLLATSKAHGACTTSLDAALLVFRSPLASSGKVLDQDAAQMTENMSPDQLPTTHHIGAPTSGVAPAHVDGLPFVGTQWFHDNIVKTLWKALPFGPIESPSDVGGLRFSGVCIVSCKTRILQSQAKCIKTLTEVSIPSGTGVANTLLNPKMQSGFRSGVCACLWVVRRTRPDLFYRVARLTCQSGKALKEDMVELNRAIRKLHHSSAVVLKYPRLPCKLFRELCVLLT